jgi:hypothetical protein
MIDRFMPVLAVLLAAGCAARGGADNPRVDSNVGVATGPEAYDKSMKVIRQHQFVIERETIPPNLYIETRWRDRAPFPDEQALGIRAAQNRIIVRGTLRSTNNLGELFSVNMTIDNRVQLAGGVDWTEAAATPQYRQYALKITDDLKRELQVGVRKY